MTTLTQKLMNLVVLPITFLILWLTLPFFFIFNFLYSTLLRFFYSENVTGKVVLITGASSGIGEHLAYEYAKRGASLVLVARRENSLREVAKRAAQLGSPDVLVVCGDVSKVDDCKRFIEEAVNHFGRLDHLVCNAGITTHGIFEEANKVTNFSPVMDVNFWGSIYPTHFAIPHLRKSKGKIIVNTSARGWFFSPRTSIYGASKAALINFYDTMRVELAPDITITILVPGFIESEITRGKHLSMDGAVEVDHEMRDRFIGMLPVESAEEGAKSLVKGVCRGDRYVIEPSWYNVFFLFHFFYPAVVERCCRFLYMSNSSTSSSPLSKRISDGNGIKNSIYPSSLQSSEIK